MLNMNLITTKKKKAMTQKNLENRVSVNLTSSRGRYKVEIEYRGKTYKCYSNDSQAYDALRNSDGENFPMTRKQALQSFYDECKRENFLGEYKF